MNIQDLSARTPSWCAGCGNYGIWASLKTALIKLGWGVDEFVIVYGIGCSGNMTDFIKSHGFHSLHGRSIPNAIGIKLANHKLHVICVVGDGDCYGEGGNHLIHAIRGNHDITVIVHDNRVYGLTTGQTAPTSIKGFKSKSTPQGVIECPINSPALAILQGASFVAQGYAGNISHLVSVFEKGLNQKGFALINVIQPCVTFNKFNTYEYYKDRIYSLPDAESNKSDKISALQLVINEEKIPIGVIYRDSHPAFHEELSVLKSGPLINQNPFDRDLEEDFNSFC